MKTLLSLFAAFSFAGVSAQTIGLSTFATGLSHLTEITNAGDSRLFAVQQDGSIKVIQADGLVNTTNFLTLTDNTILYDGAERGLLGLAFHPNYATNGYFYVDYTRASDGATVIARYTVGDNADVADQTSGTVLLTIAQPFSNHNGGTLKFGPDGFLYIGMGDGGSGGDPGNRAQNINENLGKMLRIDVDSDAPYGIPGDNPYLGVEGNDEIWAIGVRNPWKFSFDTLNGDLWIADVGQDTTEEIDHLEAPIAAGQNLGWRCYEGSVEYDMSQCSWVGTITMPVGTYTHSATGGCSIIGGYVYRGSDYPAFNGMYFFADYCLNKIGTINTTGDLSFTNNLSFGGSIMTFGQDMDGELYVNGGGTIYKIVDTSLANDQFTANGMSLYPNPSTGELYLDAPDLLFPAQFQVYDGSGKVVVDVQIENTASHYFVTGELSTGVYMVKLQDVQGNVFSTKLAVNQ
jgi:glucose/arabinose dehydrogenase